MNQEIKAQWVAALRSGEYPQGYNALRRTDTDTYCCLGVLCELAVKAEIAVRLDQDEAEWSLYKAVNSETDCASGLPPRAVVAWAEIGTSNPAVELPNGGRMEMSALNDNLRMTFAEIADLVEAQL